MALVSAWKWEVPACSVGRQCGCGKSLFLAYQIPQKVSLPLTFFEGFGAQDLYKKASVHAGCRGFAGLTM